VVDRICIAQIGAAHGVRGEMRLWPFTAEPMAVAEYGPLETEDGKRSFEFETIRPAKDHLVVRIAGVADREAAEALTNLRLYVPRERLPDTEDSDTYYHADLVGLTAVDREGAEIGTVVAVHNFGAGDILEMRPRSETKTVLLPFNDAVAPEIDLKAGRIVIVPPEGAMGGENQVDAAPPDTPQRASGA